MRQHNIISAGSIILRSNASFSRKGKVVVPGGFSSRFFGAGGVFLSLSGGTLPAFATFDKIPPGGDKKVFGFLLKTAIDFLPLYEYNIIDTL